MAYILIIAVIIAGIVSYTLGMQNRDDVKQSNGTPEETTIVSDGDDVPLVEDETPVIKEKEGTYAGAPIEIYSGISKPSETEVLDLSGRGLTGSLKAEIRMLSQLRSVDLHDNAFTGLPAEFGQLSKLEVLDLSNNQFTGIPHELGNLQNLKELNLKGNDISAFDLNIIKENLPSSTRILTD